MGGKKKKKGKGKGKGKNNGAQDPVVLIVSRACAQTLYDILPSLYECIPDLFQAVALALGLSGSLMKEKKDKKGGGKGKFKYKLKKKGKPQPRPKSKPTPASAHVTSAAVVEDVSSSVFAPRGAAPGEGFLVQVFAHLLGEKPVLLKRRATEAEPRAVRVGGELLYTPVERGTTLTFALSMEELKIDRPLQDRVWLGRTIAVQFGVTIPKDFKLGSLVGVVDICAETVPIGSSRFTFEVVESNVYLSEPPIDVGTFTRYQHAFVSYAHQDRVEVLKRLQLANVVTKEYFQDFISLEPGQRWEPVIREAIDRSDVFFLFWSHAATASKEVRKEILYAIKRQKGDQNAPPAIHPVIIEGPPPAPPPPKLKKVLHFDDKLSYLIFAAEAAAQRKANE